MLDDVQAAFFDLDKTVIAKASMVAFGKPLYDAGMINRWLVLRAVWSQFVFHNLGADERRMAKFRKSALRVTRGWEQARISQLVRETLIDVIEPIVYDEALALIRDHRAAGRRVYLVSASPEEIVAPLARYLGVDEAIASRACLDDEGRYTGEVEFYSYGPFKADAIREQAEIHGIDLEASFAYSDSITDLPMLETVGHPVVVNPDRDLARVARERSWEVRRFQQAVPLRDRADMPPRRRVLITAGLLGAAGVAGAVWWVVVARRPATPPPPSPGWAGDWAAARARARTLVGRTQVVTEGSRHRRRTAAGPVRVGRRVGPPTWRRRQETGIRRPAASSPRTQRGRERSGAR
ncbi:MAG: HAD-IB family hydrolase [Acidimicrobiales bacterium]|jgi:HAD superfamily hydrolase (TIGR01490 family)|nr:HAD-IB family hydrolase [Acidimicrobiales bacterium]